MYTLTISYHPLTGEYVYISDEGDAFYTVNKLAELMGIDTHSLTRAVWFKGVINYASKYPETLTAVWFQGVINYASEYPETLTAVGLQGVISLIKAENY